MRANEVDPSTDTAGDVGASIPVVFETSANGVDGVNISVVAEVANGLADSDAMIRGIVVLVSKVTDDVKVEVNPTKGVGEVPQRLFPPSTTHPASLHAAARTGTSPIVLHSYKFVASNPHSEEKVEPHTYQAFL